jgi:hypothetical protein
MSKLTLDQVIDVLSSALPKVGGIEHAVVELLGGSTLVETLSAAAGQITRRLLADQPPATALWEHLVVTIADRSAAKHAEAGMAACKTALDTLLDLLQEDALCDYTGEQVSTIAGALTLVMAAQPRLRQSVEHAMLVLAENFADRLQDLAQLSQDIWLRRGQMTGTPGLFVWDIRHGQWRLAQDFKPYRP